MMEVLKEWFGTLRTFEGALLVALGLGLGAVSAMSILPYISMGMIGWGVFKIITKDK